MSANKKYHKISDKAKVKSVSRGRFTITPVEPTGSLNNLGPFLASSQVVIEKGKFRMKMGPDQMSPNDYHIIPEGAKVTQIETGRFTLRPVGEGNFLNFLGPVKKKSTVTYKKGKIAVRKGPHVKRHNSIGGRGTRRKSNSSKRKSRRNKRYIV